MENNQLLPFERNRYYVGKLLTSADFQAEQTYNRYKSRFLNEMMFGSGIVCGLSVYSLDDQSIMVDGCGLEIAVENPAVRKLSAVEGFETLETELAVLCLRYREENVRPVYTVQGQDSGENYECNRVWEGWQLFLQDRESLPPICPPEPEFLASAVLYVGEEYTVTCAMSAQNACGADGNCRPAAAGERRAADVEDGFALRAVVTNTSTTEILDQAVSSASLELRNASTGQDYVSLAEIALQHARNAYLIEETLTVGIRQYIRTPSLAPLREELEVWFRKEPIGPTGCTRMGVPRPPEHIVEPIYAMGICDIPLGPHCVLG